MLLGTFFFTVGCIMLCKLKLYFKDFYKDFGFQLWVVNICLTSPLFIRGIIDLLMTKDAFAEYWQRNYYLTASYNMMIITLATYLPMVTQISSLIFGFFRHKQVKLFQSYDDNDPAQLRRQNDIETNDDQTTSHSMNSETTKTSKSDNSYFDPPIENYRFYYQGAAGNTANFTIKQRKKGNNKS